MPSHRCILRTCCCHRRTHRTRRWRGKSRRQTTLKDRSCTRLHRCNLCMSCCRRRSRRSRRSPHKNHRQWLRRDCSCTPLGRCSHCNRSRTSHCRMQHFRRSCMPLDRCNPIRSRHLQIGLNQNRLSIRLHFEQNRGPQSPQRFHQHRSMRRSLRSIRLHNCRSC